MKKNQVIILVSVIALVVVLALGILLVQGKAGIMRFQRNVEYRMGNGVIRELVIYDANGEVVLRRVGRFDFAKNDGRFLEYIETDTGVKHNIFLGAGKTLVVDEVYEKEDK